MAQRSCPTREELTAFHLGELPEAALDELGAHLETCPVCEAAARALDDVADPVAAAYRSSALAGPLTEPAVPPERVGDYEILAELGRGGMGVVYKARHRTLQRVVALKMLLGGSFVTAEERARFRIEAEAVARLRHPNIVQIYEVGEHVDAGSPRPYFTLEFADGGSLSSRLGGRPQPPRQAAAWLEALARAVHYAHQQGIVHRDLKPSNVLLTGSGEPTLCDFGVAKLLAGSDVKTRSGTLLGTAEYMAPEQAGESEAVGPAADTYSLGAILYTMLTGRPPFQGTNTLLVLAQVRCQEPVSPRRLIPNLPRDLETICLKCLQKEPDSRYASAEALADDLRRFLEGAPIAARPAPAWERGWKWAKRRPAIAGLLAAVVVLAALGVALVFGLWRGAEAQVRLETAAKDLAREKEQEEARGRQENLLLLANVTLDHGLNLCERGEVNHGLLLLARALDRAEQAGESELARVARVNLAVWRRRLVTPRARLPHDGPVTAVAFSPDGRTALTGGGDGVARRWDARTGRPRDEPLRHRHPVAAVAFRSDGRVILTGSGDSGAHEGEARLWDAESGQPLGPPLPHPDAVHGVAFSHDGSLFLTVCDGEVRVWHLEDGRPVSLVLPHPRPKERAEGVRPRLTAIFSPKGQTVLTGGEDGTARLWDAADGAAHGQPLRHDGPVRALAFSPDGGTIVTGSADGNARQWDAASGGQRGPDLPHLGAVHAVDVRFDNQFIATAGAVEERDPRTGRRTAVAGEVRLWRMATGELFGEPMRQSRPVRSVAFRRGGGKLLAGGEDREAHFYSIFDGSLLGKPLDHEGAVVNVAFSPNGLLALTASAGEPSASARLWEVAPGDPVIWSAIAVRAEGRRVRIASFAPDGEHMVGIAGDGAREYDVVTGQPAGPALTHPGLRSAFYCPDGRTILTVGAGHDLRFWERDGGRPLGACPAGAAIVSLNFSAEGGHVAVARADHRVAVCRIPSGELQGRMLQLPPSCSGLLLGPDGWVIYTHETGGSVQQWDVHSGGMLRAFKVPGSVRYLRFLAQRPVAITGQGDHLERVWDVETGRQVSGPLADVAGQISWLTFAPDGSSLLTGLWDRHAARLWDTATGKPIGPPVHHSEAVPFVAFTADGTRMMSGSVSGEFRSQEVPRPLAGDIERIRCWVEVLTGMELDAEGAIHDLDADALQQRRERLRELGGPLDRRNRPIRPAAP